MNRVFVEIISLVFAKRQIPVQSLMCLNAPRTMAGLNYLVQDFMMMSGNCCFECSWEHKK